ncbi:hypothetical protein A3D00_01030 [Candidatus Woesebacteria bacterium RIFCSPHIGHO2_02_FULL_38_9]|uniref:DUF3048 domain-containing protein n=1 Tax=Candidatus Woesebacteria bacterium RIFCSPHIGHO2_01_FULL_39_28 TaxID=1802496 RepID=A0A1F7YH24_9BACT|nr:MAG: hypothetical protein A2627_01365 [Candidatus Woesebacteria bacterium RIFCSPHIGHO2_01_FULL_39_28]OGM31708.1 MAG: hypothetical protein A3D00_01030 [Candidatus Woesebacteria bacterium RIFCSPHIGHO2_02_FULL_38_9]OGM57647.1 MAG: hypothetical protein A3A50_01405 [Candidatus Woesebacteria bacterium RIFCSPLOWO2_01_FULL_38_20]
MKSLISSNKLTAVLGLIGLYLISLGISFAVFSYLKKPLATQSIVVNKNTDTGQTRIDPNEPKTESCPINGGKFTKTEENIWQARRPLTVMIENHADSRPASGLSYADVVYEAVAEGGITRFLGIFYCGAAAQDLKLAPVRSARIYFIEWASEYGKKPIFMHVGGANNYSGSGDTVKEVRALETLESIGWRVPKGNDFDTTYDSGFPVFWRNYERLSHPVATEHTMTASSDEAYKEAEKRGFGAKDQKGISWNEKFVSWTFSDDKLQNAPIYSTISFEFWKNKPEYNVEWKYDPSSNSYLRFNGGVPHTDLLNDLQLKAKNVVIIKVKEKGPVDRNLHMLYTTIGQGEALVFKNGQFLKATWQKSSREARIKFLDEKGKEISFVGGNIWIEVIPSQNEVTYQ